jgi:hypothetical protein
LAADHEVSEVVAEIVGPFFYRRWFSKEPIDSQFVKSVVRGIVDRTSPKRTPIDGKKHGNVE